MTICYIWVEKFRNFNNTGFNLSSKYKFDFDPINSRILKKTIPSLPNNFFGENINEVTALVGKNGAGKSNAVELICKIIKNQKSTINTDYLLIYEENNELECLCNFSTEVKITTDFNIKIKDFDAPINPLKVVFFSNVFDNRRINFSKEITDVSVNNRYNRNFFIKEPTDFQKQIRLISSSIFKTLNIEHPDKVLISSKVFLNKFINSSQDSHLYRNNLESIKKFKSFYGKRLADIKPENRFIHVIRLGFFSDYINELSRVLIRKSNYNIINSFDIELHNFLEEQFEYKYRTEDISEKLLSFLKDINYAYDKIDRLSESKNELFSKQLNFLFELKELVNQIFIEYNTEGDRNKSYEYFVFDYKSKTSISIVNDLVRLFDKKNFFEINWIGISSGHKAYLNLFATLYQELRLTKQQNLFLCIDEGDLYLHPMWQIEFFDKLIEVLPAIYPGKIQLLLTSHSPFLISDLPNQNISILSKNDSNGSIDGIDLGTNTFGGNLYNLYSEPFFLKNKRTSEFAYKKIKNLILNIESKSKSNNINDLKKFIELIGDDVIKFQLLKTLEEND